MEIDDILMKNLGWPGAMLAGSKSRYSEKHPNNLVVFNSNIAIPSKGKIWYGDIDITLDLKKLKEISKLLNEPIYIFYEMDYRFEKESLSLTEAANKASRYYIVDANGVETITKK